MEEKEMRKMTIDQFEKQMNEFDNYRAFLDKELMKGAITKAGYYFLLKSKMKELFN